MNKQHLQTERHSMSGTSAMRIKLILVISKTDENLYFCSALKLMRVLLLLEQNHYSYLGSSE